MPVAWSFSPAFGPRWYPRYVLLPPPSAWPGRGGSADGGLRVVETDPAAGLPEEAAATGRAAWRRLNERRPRLAGISGGGGAGGEEVLEIEVAEGETLGSVALLSGDLLLGRAEAGGGVLRLPFEERGSTGAGSPYRTVRIAVGKPAIPRETYVLIVTVSGIPSLAELVVVAGESSAGDEGGGGSAQRALAAATRG